MKPIGNRNLKPLGGALILGALFWAFSSFTQIA
jgi:hypothetical protein